MPSWPTPLLLCQHGGWKRRRPGSQGHSLDAGSMMASAATGSGRGGGGGREGSGPVSGPTRHHQRAVIIHCLPARWRSHVRAERWACACLCGGDRFRFRWDSTPPSSLLNAVCRLPRLLQTGAWSGWRRGGDGVAGTRPPRCYRWRNMRRWEWGGRCLSGAGCVPLSANCWSRMINGPSHCELGTIVDCGDKEILRCG